MSTPKKKILAIDDDRAILKGLKMLLETAGYQVVTSTVCMDANQIKKPLPDMVLLDLRMVGVHGQHMCTMLKTSSITKHIPVIIFSADADGASIARKAGANDFVAKPFDTEELLTKVKIYI
jgi:DNA-binding response OmpR family regulator